MVLPNDTYRILDVAASRYDNSQAFVLTSTRVLWVAATEGKVNEVSLEILASCPHQKDVNDPSLRLDVSPGAYINDHKACFVCVRSINDTEMTVFWFMNPTPDTPARYHRELISLNCPSSLVGLHILPVVRLLGQAKRVSAAGRVLRNANLKFFQLLTLGHNLDVHSALCVWSDESSVTVLPPDSRLSSEESHRLRVKLLQHLTSAFAVPDEFDERIVFKEKGLGTLSLEDLRDRLELHTDFTLVAKRLSAPEELAPSAEEGLMPSAVSDQFEFLGEAVEKESKDGYMPRHSL
jgi:RNA polymerase I-specific transcription initiation factor RRN6